MIFLAGFVFIRSMIGWEIAVSRGDSRYIPKNRVRILALVCLPVFLSGADDNLWRVAAIGYLAAFAIIGLFISKSRPAASED